MFFNATDYMDLLFKKYGVHINLHRGDDGWTASIADEEGDLIYQQVGVSPEHALKMLHFFLENPEIAPFTMGPLFVDPSLVTEEVN